MLSVFSLLPASANAGSVQQKTDAEAVQMVNLLGISAQLVGRGFVDFDFDLGPDGTTATGGGNSSILGFFQGFVPDEFAPLGINGLPFDLSNDETVFPIGPEKVEVLSTGTVNLVSQFGIQIFDPSRSVVLASLYTLEAGLFQSVDAGIPVPNRTVFEDPNRPDDVLVVVAGENGLGIPIGEPVGLSFNRTVTTVPEPSSTAIFAVGSLCLAAGAGLRRKRCR
jgi:hypothetical protein